MSDERLWIDGEKRFFGANTYGFEVVNANVKTVMSMWNRFYSFVAERGGHCWIREFPNYDKKWAELARSLVPWKRFQEEYQAFLQQENGQETTVLDEREFCLIRLLDYFKSELFTWVNSLDCDQCPDSQRCGLIQNFRAVNSEFNCTNVEMYKCPNCTKILKFPRYNHAGKLLETRRGRCGEWALAFAYLCYVFGYEIRFVEHIDDHVWVEVYSYARRRWIHCDPCENAYDNPLMYECGWKKETNLILAHGMNEVRDVTYRYSSRWRETARLRRRLFQEKSIQKMIERHNIILQSNLDSITKRLIKQRWVCELVEMLRSPKQEVLEPSPQALQGRISGSIQWRLSRGETTESKNIFQIDQPTVITYDCNQDCYLIQTGNQPSQEIKNWNRGCFETENIFRMVEMDWKKCYLSRNRNSTEQDIGHIVWRFQFKKNLPQWKSIQILIRGETFESGVVELEFQYGDYKKEFYLNEQLEIKSNEIPLQTVPFFDIKATLMFGNDKIAWQHAQLFRQNTSQSKTRDEQFRIEILY